MRARPFPVVLSLVTLLLAPGCGRHGGGRQGTAGGLAAPNARLNAAGETPSWSAVVRPRSLVLSIGDGAPLQVEPTATDRGKAGATWRGELPNHGGPVSLDVSPKPCKDSETGLAYPLTAVASAQGHRYAGCAAHPGQGLGPRT